LVTFHTTLGTSAIGSFEFPFTANERYLRDRVRSGSMNPEMGDESRFAGESFVADITLKKTFPRMLPDMPNQIRGLFKFFWTISTHIPSSLQQKPHKSFKHGNNSGDLLDSSNGMSYLQNQIQHKKWVMIVKTFGLSFAVMYVESCRR